MIYYPTYHIEVTPDQKGLEYEDIYFIAKDNIRLNGWLIKSQQAKVTLLFLHGNGGNISHRIDKIASFHKMGLNVFIFDYRGYGKSQGSPSEKGLYADAVAAYDYLKSRKDTNALTIIGYGESLGGAIAVDLVTRRNLAALILDSTFTSIPDMAKEKAPLIPRFLISTQMNSLKKIKNIDVPKFFIHSPQDEVIPYYMGKRLFNAASSPKGFLNLSGGHNDAYFRSKKEFIDGIEYFLTQIGLK